MSPPDTDLPASGASAGRGADSMLQRALTLIEQSGALIFPLHHAIGGRCSCGNDKCKSVGKHPIERGWQRDASASELVVRAWWARHPHANIGLLAGQHAGIVVIDIDGAVGLESLRAIEARYGALPLTPRVITSRGIHLYFIYPSDATEGGVRNNASAIAPGIDVRGNGGYVVAPGSVHESGHVYAWVAGCELGAFPVAELPEWAMANDVLGLAPSPTLLPPPPTTPAVHPSVNGAARHDAYLRAALDRECNTLARSPEGARNTALNTAAFNLGLLVAGGELDADTVRSRLYPIAIRIGLGERETRKTIESGITRAAQKDARRVPPPTSSSVGDHGTRSRVVAAVNGHTPEPVGPPAAASPSLRSPIERLGVREIFAALPPSRWAVPDLQIGPGRPTMFAGYGASAKTLAAQQFALAKASGSAIWGRHECKPGVVLHMDYEQGRYGTSKRYQRLALGHDIAAERLEGRLFVSVLPRIFLDDDAATELFLREFEGVDVAIIDALRGAAPNSDENDSSIRRTLDVLTWVSEQTGTTCIVLHHAAKAERDDKRMVLRGSGAIYDACGCVLVFESSGDGPKHVSQEKQPTEAESPKIAPFDIEVEDVIVEDVKALRVMSATPTATDVASKARRSFDRDAERLLTVVRGESGISANSLIERAGMGRTRAFKMLVALVDEKRLAVFAGDDGTKRYRVLATEAG